MPGTGIKPSVMEEIRACARRHGLRSVVLFGSRARGDYREKSDIDLALSGGGQTGFVLDVEEHAPTLLSFDFVDIDGSVQGELRDIISREGVVLYEEA